MSDEIFYAADPILGDRAMLRVQDTSEDDYDYGIGPTVLVVSRWFTPDIKSGVTVLLAVDQVERLRDSLTEWLDKHAGDAVE